MFMSRSEYDMGVNTFSPEGRLFQIEYAFEAINLGSTAIGIQGSDGCILAVEKRITSKLIVPSSLEKIMEIDAHIACTNSGLNADAKTLVDKARVEAQSHWFTYDEKMRVESVTQTVSNLALAFGDDKAEAPMSRPFGVSLLFAGIDENGPQLMHMDPSGTFTRYYAKAIGAGAQAAQQLLKEAYHKEMTVAEALKKALTILKEVMDEKLSSTNIEICVIRKGVSREDPTRCIKIYNAEEMEKAVAEM